jgi:hypothetical protein
MKSWRVSHPGAEISVYIEQQPSKARSVMRSVELGVRYFFLRESMSRSKISVKSVFSNQARQAGHLCRRSDSRKYKARKNASVEEIGGLMESSAPVTWKRISVKQMMYAMLFVHRATW